MYAMLASVMNQDSKERRLHPRVEISVRVRVAYSGQEFMAQSLNVSAGGMLIQCTPKIPAGTRVGLKFTIPIIAKYPIRAEAEVVWCIQSPRGLALRFTEVSTDDRDLLGELALHNGQITGEH